MENFEVESFTGIASTMSLLTTRAFVIFASDGCDMKKIPSDELRSSASFISPPIAYNVSIIPDDLNRNGNPFCLFGF
jgi:hypothetical protein